ncbi:class I SAM-dependent methyltransferase [Pseudonocardia ailaonensis]|uniref:Class I SAM-dependent methyltransferase n=1 Tax=Pseudonocardia ailaonensis TaxID=367279 RepID=A0ABN2NEY6_9PSEU
MTQTGSEFWEQRYLDTDPTWGTRPNAALVALLGDLPATPGRSCELACGQGGDALWLAGLGWDVTAVDVSPTAVGRVRQAAAATGLTVTAIAADLAETAPPTGPFDLLHASYFHSPVEIPRAAILRRAAAEVTVGGRLALVDHGSAAPWSWNQDAVFPTPAQVLAELDLGPGWTVERCENVPRVATGPDGETATVQDTVLLLRRTA